jgi:hypothetical protein
MLWGHSMVVFKMAKSEVDTVPLVHVRVKRSDRNETACRHLPLHATEEQSEHASSDKLPRRTCMFRQEMSRSSRRMVEVEMALKVESVPLLQAQLMRSDRTGTACMHPPQRAMHAKCHACCRRKTAVQRRVLFVQNQCGPANLCSMDPPH